MTTQLTDVDREAITRAIEITRKESRARRRQVDAKLRTEPFEAVGRFCAFSAQIEFMHLQPWESTIVYTDLPESHALRRRLIAAGLSKYEPDPLAALERVETRQLS